MRPRLRLARFAAVVASRPLPFAPLVFASLLASLGLVAAACFGEANAPGAPPDGGYARAPEDGGGYLPPGVSPPYLPDAGTICDDASACNGVCTDTQDLSTSCGGCAIACASGQLCASGSCVPDALTKLSFDVVDAEYSLALDRVIAVGATPMALHVYDPGAKSDAPVPLPATPTCVSVGPDGRHAAVGYDAFLSYVDLDTRTVLGTFPVSDPIQDVVLAGNGNAYAFPSSDEGAIHEVNLSTGTDTEVSNGLYLEASAALHPNGEWIYAAQTGETPSSLIKYDISDGGFTQTGQLFGGSYDPCGALWISKDGLRIFTGCGYVFSASSTPSEDMQYAGELGTSMQRIGSVDETDASVAAIFSNTEYGAFGEQADLLARFSAEYLAQTGTQAMPRYQAGAQSFATEGKFAFFRADGATVVLIVEADPASNAELPFAIATL